MLLEVISVFFVFICGIQNIYLFSCCVVYSCHDCLCLMPSVRFERFVLFLGAFFSPSAHLLCSASQQPHRYHHKTIFGWTRGEAIEAQSKLLIGRYVQFQSIAEQMDHMRLLYLIWYSWYDFEQRVITCNWRIGWTANCDWNCVVRIAFAFMCCLSLHLYRIGLQTEGVSSTAKGRRNSRSLMWLMNRLLNRNGN